MNRRRDPAESLTSALGRKARLPSDDEDRDKGVDEREEARMFGEEDLWEWEEPEEEKPVEQKAEQETVEEEEPEEEEAEQEEEEAEQEEETEEEGETEEETTEEGEPVEEVEIDEDEYNFLKGLDKDDLIARIVKHRKGSKTLQSRLDKVAAVVGHDFIKAAEAGKVPREVGRLIRDLYDEAFQQHLAQFYDTHELRDGRYVKVRDVPPPPDLLREYANTVVELSSMTVHDFLPEGEDFDANEAFNNPASPSAKALRDFENKKRELEQKLVDLESRAREAQPEPVTAEKRAELGQKALQALVERHEELQRDPKALENFKSFVAENIADPLEVFYEAYRARSRQQKRTHKLVVREVRKIASNRRSSQQPERAKQKRRAGTLSNVRPEDRDLVKEDHDYFGDIL